MEFLKSNKRRSRLSEIAYVVLNIALAVLLLVVAVQFNNLWLSIVFVVISKWRILAVRPRYWVANITANVVDLVVGIGHVIFLQAATGQFWLQVLMTTGYIAWLLFVKPRSKRIFVAAQAIAAIAVGTNALILTQYNSDAAIFVIAMWVIGYTSCRHILMSYDEPMTNFYSAIWGVIMAQLGWIGFHWQIAYSLPNTANFKLSQLALITALLTFLATRAYESYHRHGAIKSGDVIVPFVFVLTIVGLLLTMFNQSTVGL